MNDSIVKFIEDNAGPNSFTGGVSLEKIDLIRSQLKVQLPQSYKWFLSNLGSGGIYGVDILGYGRSENPRVVLMTERYRTMGVPPAIVVVEHCDEFGYCLDTSKMVNGECPVVSYSLNGSFLNQEATDFLEFFQSRLSEAKVNWSST
jgi:hypothetical protein